MTLVLESFRPIMSSSNQQALPAITLAAIGVVYGDIGTSPLYTFKECRNNFV